jgi:hypothetical protein
MLAEGGNGEIVLQLPLSAYSRPGLPGGRDLHNGRTALYLSGLMIFVWCDRTAAGVFAGPREQGVTFVAPVDQGLRPGGDRGRPTASSGMNCCGLPSGPRTRVPKLFESLRC